MATQLSDLRDKVRRRTDTVSNPNITDSDLTDFINDAYAEVYGMYASKQQDHFLADPVAKTISSGNTIDLTSASLGSRMLYFRGIDYSTGGGWVRIRPFEWYARELFSNQNQSVTGNYQIWYVPEVTKLSGNSDEVHAALAGNDIETWMVLRAACAVLAKQERDPSMQDAEANRLWRQLEYRACTRGQPKHISDDDGSALPTMWNGRNDRFYRLRGSKVEIFTGWPSA